ncbi:MAG: transposase, partial [Polyangiaceae bacterium]
MSARRIPRSAPRKPRRSPRAASRTARPTRKQAAPKPTPRKRPKSGSPARRRSTTRRSTSPSKTTQLSLSGRGTWGGYRAGSGRKRIARDARGYVPHTRRPKVTKSTPVHATLRCVDGLPSLRRKTHKRIIEAVFKEENRKGFRLIHFSIQGNHLHLIAEGNSTQALSRGIQRLSSRIARTLNKRWGRRGKFFKERFDGKVIRTPRQMRNALRYVLLNH